MEGLNAAQRLAVEVISGAAALAFKVDGKIGDHLREAMDEVQGRNDLSQFMIDSVWHEVRCIWASSFGAILEP